MTRPGLPKLVATDLDGTLVRSDDTVSAYSHEILGRVRAAGIPIVGVTGRGTRRWPARSSRRSRTRRGTTRTSWSRLPAS